MGVRLSTPSITTAASIPTSPFYINDESLETFILVWFDASVGDPANKSLQTHLRQYVTNLITFNDIKQCEQWLKNRSNNEKIFVIIPGELGKRLISDIHDLPSIIAIYVFCWQPDIHRIWAQTYPKIRAVISRSDELLQQISKDENRFENIENMKGIYLFADDQHSREINFENATFLWYQLFLDILISPLYLPSKPSSVELIRLLRHMSSNDTEILNLINQFEETYDRKKAVTSFVTNTPLSRLIKKALREQNISMLFYLRFFLVDIYNQLITSPTRADRAYGRQLMSQRDIEYISTNLNQYLIFNGFILTSTQQLDPSVTDDTDRDFRMVFIEIDTKDFMENTQLAFLRVMGNVNNNSETLFMCGSIFKIISMMDNRNSTCTLRLSLIGCNGLRILRDQKLKLQQTKDLLFIANLLDESNQPSKAIEYCQQLLRELPPNHPLVSQIKYRIDSHSEIQSVSLHNVQFILIDLSTRLSQLAGAMLQALHVLVNDSILIRDRISEIDFNRLSNKTILLFTSSQIISSITQPLTQVSKIFILEEDPEKIDQRERFDNSEDLIFQLADELYQNYQREAMNHLQSGDQILARQKKEIANQIYTELKEVYRNFFENHINNQQLVCPLTSVVWLKDKGTHPNSMDRLQNRLRDIISSFSIFDDEQQCYLHICTAELDKIVFLIIDNCYKESSVAGFQQFLNIKKLYRYRPSSINEMAEKFGFQFLYDLIEYYNKLGNEYRSRKNIINAKEMFFKAQQLCEHLIEL